MTDEIVCPIWVCVDCMLTHANGECGEDPDREPLSAIPGGHAVTMGMLLEEHHSECPNRIAGLREWDCDCEHRAFSASSCEGCGSDLGGERHALTLWRAS